MQVGLIGSGNKARALARGRQLPVPGLRAAPAAAMDDVVGVR